MSKAALAAAALLCLLAGGLFLFRTPVMLQLITWAGPPPLAALETIVLGPDEGWTDDYYTVEKIDPQTFAISEPRYFRDVYSYLLVGRERALLIDSGSPLRDISQVVRKLTDKPVSVIATHLHFDHVGNHDKFEHVLMPDLPHLRARTQAGRFVPDANEHLGSVEGFGNPGWQVSDWVPIGSEIDLGGRQVTLLYTPGHTPDSISILEDTPHRLFMGDYAGDGEIYAFMPNSSLQAYLDTTTGLLNLLPPVTLLYAAHGGAETNGVPASEIASLRELRAGLEAMRDGRLAGAGFWPKAYPVNGNTVLLTDWQGPGGRAWDFRGE